LGEKDDKTKSPGTDTAKGGPSGEKDKNKTSGKK